MSQSTTSPSNSHSLPAYPHDKGRLRIILSYWAVVLVCLPVWWGLTTVQRLPLPAAQVKDAGSRTLRIPIDVKIDVLDDLCDAASFAAQVQMGWNEAQSAQRGSIWDALDVVLGTSEPERLDRSGVVYRVTVRQGYEEDPIVIYNRSFDIHSRSGCDQPLVDKVVSSLRELLAPPIQHTELRVAQYAPRYRVAFSLLNEDASDGGAVTGWLVEQAIRDHLQPILCELDALHNFTVESQVQFYAPLTSDPVAAHDGYVLNQEQLTIFVNSAEWTLSSSVSNDPVLHFVLYVPSSQRRPLYIQDSHGAVSKSNSFLVPQWGGIAIFNPTTEGTANMVLDSKDLAPVFHLFKRQLEGLLGIPTLPALASVNTERTSTSRKTLTEWQLDTLLRRRTLENVQGSVQALTSIVGLVGQIENMPVGQTVRSDVLSALDELAQVHNTSQPIQTLFHSARSLLLASKAFFNPDMVGLLYFPAEHKYAVYTPLFAPIAVPLIVSVIRELKARRNAAAMTHGRKSKAE
ncbi:GPI transamidase component PIG-S [Ceratobasidium sp. AG-Ba]|nr:GPI transamidase component PIG-S [Ceratobasidium sp. AG-Ba]